MKRGFCFLDESFVELVSKRTFFPFQFSGEMQSLQETIFYDENVTTYRGQGAGPSFVVVEKENSLRSDGAENKSARRVGVYRDGVVRWCAAGQGISREFFFSEGPTPGGWFSFVREPRCVFLFSETRCVEVRGSASLPDHRLVDLPDGELLVCFRNPKGIDKIEFGFATTLAPDVHRSVRVDDSSSKIFETFRAIEGSPGFVHDVFEKRRVLLRRFLWNSRDGSVSLEETPPIHLGFDHPLEAIDWDPCLDQLVVRSFETIASEPKEGSPIALKVWKLFRLESKPPQLIHSIASKLAFKPLRRSPTFLGNGFVSLQLGYPSSAVWDLQARTVRTGSYGIYDNRSFGGWYHGATLVQTLNGVKQIKLLRESDYPFVAAWAKTIETVFCRLSPEEKKIAMGILSDQDRGSRTLLSSIKDSATF